MVIDQSEFLCFDEVNKKTLSFITELGEIDKHGLLKYGRF